MSRPIVAALTAVLALSCSAPESVPRRNVVVVVVDTLRADHLGLYGYERPTTPALERFAERAVVFDNALAQAGCTFPSVNSMLTSKYPQRFQVEEPRRLEIPEGVPSLAEILRAEGYSTAAISSSQIVRNTPSDKNPDGGFGRGFDRFDEVCERQRAPCVRQRTIDAIDTMDRPFFVYTHFFEPHHPYLPDPQHERRFATRRPRKKWVRDGNPGPIIKHLYRRWDRKVYNGKDIADLTDLYDEEILYFDSQFEVFIDQLEERNLLSDTVIVFASDHGEELFDHGEFAHCRDMGYNTILRTPLMIYLPGADMDDRRGRRSALAQNLDLVPTVLDYLGIDPTGRGFEGRSLRPVIESDQPVHEHLFASQGTTRVITDGQYKLLLDVEERSPRLFDWQDDPAETTDLADSEPQTVERLRAALFDWIEEVEGTVAPAELEERAAETERHLRAVGYL